MAEPRTDEHQPDDWDAPRDSESRTGASAFTGHPDAADTTPVHHPDAADTTGSRGTNERYSSAVTAEHENLVAERQARRDARVAALAPAPTPDPATTYPPAASTQTDQPAPVRTETVTVTRRSTDRWHGSLALFVLRLVTAAIMGVHGLNKLLNLPATTEALSRTILPQPGIMAIVIGAAEIAIAIGLVFGLLTRLAGLGLMLVTGGALALVLWGPWSPFQPGQSGFIGELEVLLLAVGFLFLLVGAGGWSVDRGFRSRREADRAV